MTTPHDANKPPASALEGIDLSKVHTIDPESASRVLEEIEWVDGKCPYCRASEDDNEHDDSCELAGLIDALNEYPADTWLVSEDAANDHAEKAWREATARLDAANALLQEFATEHGVHWNNCNLCDRYRAAHLNAAPGAVDAKWTCDGCGKEVKGEPCEVQQGDPFDSRDVDSYCHDCAVKHAIEGHEIDKRIDASPKPATVEATLEDALQAIVDLDTMKWDEWAHKHPTEASVAKRYIGEKVSSVIQAIARAALQQREASDA